MNLANFVDDLFAFVRDETEPYTHTHAQKTLIMKVTHSGLETGGSGGSVNRGPELLGAPESGAKKVSKPLALAAYTASQTR